MVFRNKEVRLALLILSIWGFILTIVGFLYSSVCGWLVLGFCSALLALYAATEYYRYAKLRKLTRDLDDLLSEGTKLPIEEYDEGELSILANHIQKITLRLLESGESAKADRVRLADSLADISHQLRTPLTAIHLTATMLQARELSEKLRIELSRELQGLLNQMQWLVEALLKLSKLDAGTVTLAKNPVSVKELISRAAAPIAINMELREQRLLVDCREETFLGDLVWSGEALGNILKNAMEHTPNGGTITVTAEENALFTQISIEDTGPGFAEKDMANLFQRFYRGSNAAENSYGIGLALARTVITAQNGTVQAMNGKSGAKFVIKFYKQIL